jgi:metal-responsive CopG/Arc/MetJ family transcriptional regulator
MADKNELPEQVTISGFPAALLRQIDKIAEAERRARSKQVIVLLEEIVAARKAGVAMAN